MQLILKRNYCLLLHKTALRRTDVHAMHFTLQKKAKNPTNREMNDFILFKESFHFCNVQRRWIESIVQEILRKIYRTRKLIQSRFFLRKSIIRITLKIQFADGYFMWSSLFRLNHIPSSNGWSISFIAVSVFKIFVWQMTQYKYSISHLSRHHCVFLGRLWSGKRMHRHRLVCYDHLQNDELKWF